ncbi:MAG: tetraacyldisaccharide 4'-kinase [Rufibacter sp.]
MQPPSPFLRFLLFPFAALYGGVVWVRNKLYDWGIFSAYQAPIPVICVGNLTVGGTGKTPQVEYLAKLFKDKKLAILSRGYKRETKGFMLADETASAATLGDESFQYVQSLPWAKVAVCEKRAEGIQLLLQRFPELELILLDDAYQHRAVKASFNLLLTDYGRLFTNDYVLPAGLLREPRTGAKRADAVVVTKCPEKLPFERISNQISRYTRLGTPIYFSRIAYAPAVPIGHSITLGKKLVLVTAIANPTPMKNYLVSQGHEVVKQFKWPDHASVTQQKIQEVTAHWQKLQDPDVSIIMTQKDAVKWQAPELRSYWKKLPVFYLPIEVTFAAQGPEFDASLRRAMLSTGFEINS